MPEQPIRATDLTAGNNLRAFMESIATFESDPAPRGYVMLVGGGEFEDFRDHPGNLGWAGIPLPDHQCIAAGMSPGCRSYAAGRYQITRTTWNRLRHRKDLHLPDFSPESQDTACIALIDEQGAIGDVMAGNFNSAIEKCADVWASMPGANYKQREHSLDKWRTAYAEAGGMVVA